MANHSLPTTTSNYSTFPAELNARIDDAIKWVSTANTTPTNGPVGAVRWDDTNKKWIIALTANWATSQDLSTYYNININGTVGATTQNSGAFTTLSSSGVASLGANSTVGGVAIVTASNTVTLTNKTLTSPVISTIVNTGTLTLPTVTDTLVGRLSTDTLTNKTLTDPKLSSASGIKDANGVNLILFPAAVASAVNYITVTNTVTLTAPSITAAGTDTNISLNLVSKGTGVVTANGIQVVDLSSSQTLTNKTLTTPVISSISNSGTVTIPTGTDTLVNLTGTQSLSNKTLTASAFNGTLGATTPAAATVTTLQVNTSLSVSGTATATTFSGAGTSLTGTAASLSIGGTATNSTNSTITNDTTTATAVYPTWVTSNSGNLPNKVSSTSLSFVPSTGILSATGFAGSGAGLTGTASSLTAGAANSVAWTNVSGRFTDLNQFSNASGFVTSSGTIANATTAASCSGNAASASTVTINYNNDSNSTYQMLWGSGNSVYGTGGVYCNPYTDTIYASVLYANGSVYSVGDVTSYSDERLKKNWKSFDNTFVENLAKIKSGIYERTDIGATQVGVSAQSLQTLLPNAVVEDEKGILSVVYGNAALVACIELAKEVVRLKEEIKVLHASIIR